MKSHIILVLACLLGGAPTAAFAVDQFVFGQVFQIGSAAAADASIPDSGLGGKPYPYVHVAVYNRNTGALLGQGDAGGNGQFTVVFPRPAGPSLDIECRVTKVVDGDSRPLPAARPAFSSFSGIRCSTSPRPSTAGIPASACSSPASARWKSLSSPRTPPWPCVPWRAWPTSLPSRRPMSSTWPTSEFRCSSGRRLPTGS